MCAHHLQLTHVYPPPSHPRKRIPFYLFSRVPLTIHTPVRHLPPRPVSLAHTRLPPTTHHFGPTYVLYTTYAPHSKYSRVSHPSPLSLKHWLSILASYVSVSSKTLTLLHSRVTGVLMAPHTSDSPTSTSCLRQCAPVGVFSPLCVAGVYQRYSFTSYL